MEQENQLSQSYANRLELEKKEIQKNVFSLEQEMKEAQDNAHQLACKSDDEKHQALDLLNNVERENILLRRQVEDLERRLKQVQKVSFITIIVIIIAILVFKIAI